MLEPVEAAAAPRAEDKDHILHIGGHVLQVFATTVFKDDCTAVLRKYSAIALELASTFMEICHYRKFVPCINSILGRGSKVGLELLSLLEHIDLA